MNQNIDYNSRDYDPKSIEADPRFTQTTKEMLITFGVYAVFIILMICNILFIGGENVSNYSYVLGLPLWIFFLICIIVLYVVAVCLVTKFVYKEMDLSPDGKLHDYIEKGGQAK